jgi:transposase
MKQHPGLRFQQDNAGGHSARYTHEQLELYGIHVIFWPAFSPDLSPIETVWDWIKDWIQEYDPTVHRSYKRLRAAVIQAWGSIPHEKIRTLIRDTMRERCQAVIDAQGGETKF